MGFRRSSSSLVLNLLFLLLLSTHSSSSATYDDSDYECLPDCECDYSQPSQRLEINCGVKSQPKILKIINASLRTLVLKNVALKNRSDFETVLPRGLAADTLKQLELHNVVVDPPEEFFNSNIFNQSKNSLRSISIFQSTTTTTEIFIGDYTEKLIAFATLRGLDSLTICDSSSLLAQIVLQALPSSLQHVKVVSSSISDIYYSSFSHLIALQSLNLSHNHLASIPNGLLDNLVHLEILDISHNHLTHLQEGIFTGLGHLRRLDLSHNLIQYVDAELFSSLRRLEVIDLNENEVIQFFKPYFKYNANLKSINMSNAWISDTFVNENANRSYHEMEGLISSLQAAEVIDLSNNQMTLIPETLSHVPQLRRVYLGGNPWSCTCQDRWFLYWVRNSQVSLPDDTSCHNRTNPEGMRYPIVQFFENQNCTGFNNVARYPFKYYAILGGNKVLNCHTKSRSKELPKITWITPAKQQIIPNGFEEGKPVIFEDGALMIPEVHVTDFGMYKCIASYGDFNITHYVHVGMDISAFNDVKWMSIVVGLISSFGFLLLVLLAQLIRFLLLRSGLECIAIRTANQARRVRAFFDSIEQNKNNQLEWLRQNYNMQAKKIQDNCLGQLEKIRESYANQTKNLSEFKEYSAQQLAQMRDQYQDQIRRVSSYSAHRLGRVRENYVFNRHRVGKFSSHQLIKLREAYKWQAQTLNKILENLPQTLNLDACRGVGACGRTDSMYLEDDLDLDTPVGQSQREARFQRHDDEEEGGRGGKNNEHVSLLIPPEFMVSYLSYTPHSDFRQILEMDQREEEPATSGVPLNNSPEKHNPKQDLNGAVNGDVSSLNLNLPFADEVL